MCGRWNLHAIFVLPAALSPPHPSLSHSLMLFARFSRFSHFFFYFFIILILFRWPGNSWNLLLPIGLTSPCAPTNIFTYIQTSIYSSFQYCIFLCACIRACFSANCPSTNWLLTDQFCIFWHIRHAPFCICNSFSSIGEIWEICICLIVFVPLVFAQCLLI